MTTPPKVGDPVRVKMDDSSRVTDFLADLEADRADGYLTGKDSTRIETALFAREQFVVTSAKPDVDEYELSTVKGDVPVPWCFNLEDLEVAP